MLRGARIALGAYPTPVERLAAGPPAIWVKRDDLTSDIYGGNKVRKLELLLGAARDAGRTRILTVGAIGSHQVVATAIFGQRLGLEVDAVVVAQPASVHAERNIRTALAHGLHARPCPAWSLAPAYVAASWRRDAYFVPLGGLNVLGTLGFVDAAHELAAQIAGGALPEPDVAIVAMGSGGTAAGLAVGFEQAGLRTRVVAVAVSPPSRMLGHVAKRLAQKTAAAAGLPPASAFRAVKRLEVDGSFIGKGYGHPTAEGAEATSVARRGGVSLDPTYTAKAFACALAHAGRAGAGNILYWHTLSGERQEPGERRPPLEPALAALLR